MEGQRRLGTKQFSVRVAAPVYEALAQRAHAVAETRNALSERYISEGLRLDEHPAIRFRDGILGRRAALAGTRLDVWQVIDTLRQHDNSAAATASYLGLPETKVRDAVRYYAAYRDEVDTIAQRERAAAERAEAAWRAEQELLAG